MKAILLLFVVSTLTISPTVDAEIWKDHLSASLKKASTWDELKWLISGFVVAGSMQNQDQQNLVSAQKDISLSNNLDQLGDAIGTGVPGSLTALTQYLLGDKVNARAHFETIIYTGVSTAVLKGSFARTRPNGGKHSHPSGHTSTAFASATSLTIEYGWKAAVIAYPLALLTAAQRLESNSHWPSDLVAGAALGIFWARVVHSHELAQFTPVALNSGLGVYWQKNF